MKKRLNVGHSTRYSRLAHHFSFLLLLAQDKPGSIGADDHGECLYRRGPRNLPKDQRHYKNAQNITYYVFKVVLELYEFILERISAFVPKEPTNLQLHNCRLDLTK